MTANTPAVLVARETVTDHIALLTFDVGARAQRHTAAGQYVVVTPAPGQVAYLALANTPGSARFDLLVKGGADAADALRALAVGDTVEMSDPQGAGFGAIDPGHDVWFVSVGTALSPVLAALQHALDEGLPAARARLLHGTQRLADVPFQAALDALVARGVQVDIVCSKERGAGLTGYVQAHLPDAFEAPGRTTAVVCGMPPMQEAVRAAFEARGLGSDAVRHNF